MDLTVKPKNAVSSFVNDLSITTWPRPEAQIYTVNFY